MSIDSLPIFKCLRKKASGKLRWCMWISNQDSIGRKNVQYGWKRQRRRRLLSSWVKVSMTRTSRILPNKTRINCWLATIRFCMASKQQRRAIKSYRGGILLCDQSLTGNDLKGNALSRNLGNYLDWLTFVVTQIIRTSQVRTLLRKQKIRCYRIFITVRSLEDHPIGTVDIPCLGILSDCWNFVNRTMQTSFVECRQETLHIIG